MRTCLNIYYRENRKYQKNSRLNPPSCSRCTRGIKGTYLEDKAVGSEGHHTPHLVPSVRVRGAVPHFVSSSPWRGQLCILSASARREVRMMLWEVEVVSVNILGAKAFLLPSRVAKPLSSTQPIFYLTRDRWMSGERWWNGKLKYSENYHFAYHKSHMDCHASG